MANIDEALDASLDIARLSIANSNDATVPLSNQSCTSDKMSYAARLAVPHFDHHFNTSMLTKETLKSRNSESSWIVKEASDKSMQLKKETSRRQDADRKRASALSKMKNLKTEHRSVLNQILNDISDNGEPEFETVLRIIFQTRDRLDWLESMFNECPFNNGHTTLKSVIGDPAIPEIESQMDVDRKVFFVRYQNNEPVGIRTHLFSIAAGKWTQTLFNVSDVIGAVKLALAPRFDATPMDELTLHAVAEDVEGSRLEPDLLLSTLSDGLSAMLVIKSKRDIENIHMDLSRRPSDPWGNEVAVFLGRIGSSDSEGVTIGRRTTVSRDDTVSNILEKLRRNNPLLIKSPPMSGKTSMASLISNRLKTTATEKCLIINLSILDLSSHGKGWEFESSFEEEVGVKWSDLHLLAKNRTIYLIFDEVQVIYQPPTPLGGRPKLPSNKSSCVWNLVKATMTNRESNIRILLFSAYGSSLQSSLLATPVVFTAESMLGIDWMIFTDAELKDFVVRNVDAAKDPVFAVRNLDAAKEPAKFTEDPVDQFCANLKRITGSHCGLCYSTVRYLNQVLCASERKRGTLTADHVLRSLDNPSIFNHLQTSRALVSANTVTEEELALVKSVVFSEGMVLTRDARNAMPADATSITQHLVQRGVLVECGAQNQEFVFSSPVMKRFFTEKVFGMPAGRAQENPDTLDDLVYAIVSSMDYEHIQASLGKTKKTGILLERAWQMEFYKASFQCTCDYVTSADVGGLFGTTGAIDFTVHSSDMQVFWGIELLREGIRLEEHVRRFDSGGRYEAMCRKFTNTCVLDIRQQPKGGAGLDLKDLDTRGNLFVFTYDDSFASGILYSKSWAGGKAVSFSKIKK
ncbi:hypothetical protein BJ741DRAFT_669245 [Chytriomyces cf. hyalinus JEL632]|nr:hypothetical protein BJ741DRAFT_669245 [Chytriomyces cf. hyalinus JEL632]